MSAASFTRSRPRCPSTQVLLFFRSVLDVPRPGTPRTITPMRSCPSPGSIGGSSWRSMSSVSASMECASSQKVAASSKSAKKLLHPRWHKGTTDIQQQLDAIVEQRHSMDARTTFKTLRSLLYNVAQNDYRQSWKIYRVMVHLRVADQLKANHYGRLLNAIKYGPYARRQVLAVLADMQYAQKAGRITITGQHYGQILFGLGRLGLIVDMCRILELILPAAAATTMAATTVAASLLQPNHFTSLATAAKKHNDLRTSIHVSQMMIQAMQNGMKIEPRACVIMVSALAADMEATVEFLTAMKQAGMFANDDNKALDDELNAASQERTGDHEFNRQMYTSLIAGLAKKGDSTNAKRLWDEMHVRGFEPSTVTVAAMVEAFGRAGDLHTALEWVEKHISEHQTLNMHMATSFLVNAVRHGHVDLAKDTLTQWQAQYPDELAKMDAQFHSAVLWIKAIGCVDESRAYFDQLYHANPDYVDAVMVNHLIKAYGDAQQKENVIESFALHETVASRGNDRDPFDKEKDAASVPRLHNQHAPHSYLVDALFKCREVPSALSAFVAMRKQGVPDDITTAMVIRGLIMNDEKELAWQFFKVLQTTGIEPNLHAYTSIISACQPAHSHPAVAMPKNAHFAKNHESTASPATSSSALIPPKLVKAALHDQWPVENDRDDHFAELPPSPLHDASTTRSRGPTPTAVAPDATLSPTQAYILFRKMTASHEPNEYTYTALISCFAKENMNRAMDIFAYMCADTKVKPTIATYVALLQGCAVFRQGQMALKVFRHLQDQPHLVPNDHVWHYLLKALVRSRMDKKEINRLGAIVRARKQAA
ncbi:hypothetical protein BC940DRAFT_345396 [Gongronella butleri]|nr:hypothetical protein BC940DRAFT_345396 [Gongronella butleri]